MEPDVASPAGGSTTQLSSRECEVLTLAARGLTNTEIGVRIGVTVHAVKFHLASIYRKLGVSNRTEAAVAYLLDATSSSDRSPGS